MLENNEVLDGVLEAIATEAKTINDETKLSILYSPNNGLSGWKLSDYQTILSNNNVNGEVYDDSTTPNIIYVELHANQSAAELMKELDAYRLPHTAFCFKYTAEKSIYVTATRRTLQINYHAMRA